MTDRHPSFELAMKHFNQPVIVMFEVVRLIGWGQDEDDAYFIFRYRGGHIERSSVVGGFIPLTALQTQDTPDGIRHAMEDPARNDFHQLDKWLHFNGAPKADAFIIEEAE